MALVVLRQNRMMIVARFEGYISVDQLIQKLVEAIRDNEAYIVAARAERQERQINQVLWPLTDYQTFFNTGPIFLTGSRIREPVDKPDFLNKLLKLIFSCNVPSSKIRN